MMLKRKKRWMPILFVMMGLLLALTACGQNDKGTDNGSSGGTGSTNGAAAPEAEPPKETEVKENVPDPNASHPIVTIEMDSGKTIKLELYPEVAPNTVNNFISLVKKGFYDGTGFHRVIPGFMIQGGDPDGNGTGGPGYAIAGEFASNSFQNDLKHTKGVLSMARAQDPNSAGSQFFIMVADAPSLDGEYASFGKVIEGMETAEEIVNLERDQMDMPLEIPVMKKVTVDTLGKDYPEPEKQ